MTERVLVATHSRFIYWDGEKKHVLLKRPHENALYYGITWNEKEIYVAEGAANSRNSRYHIFDKDLNRVGELPIGKGISDPHQILWWSGKLYITSAAQDSVFVWDGKSIRRIFWMKMGEPRLHPNSVWCDGEKFYVVEHRYREMPKRIRVFNLDFEVVGCIEITKKGFLKSRPRGCHNVYIENGILYMCSPNVIVRHDLISGKSRPILFSFLAREAHRVTGMARPPGRFIIGLQRVAVRTERGKGDSAFLVMNDDFEVLDTVPMKGAGGVNEVRAIDGPDLAHNRIECPFH